MKCTERPRRLSFSAAFVAVAAALFCSLPETNGLTPKCPLNTTNEALCITGPGCTWYPTRMYCDCDDRTRVVCTAALEDDDKAPANNYGYADSKSKPTTRGGNPVDTFAAVCYDSAMFQAEAVIKTGFGSGQSCTAFVASYDGDCKYALLWLLSLSLLFFFFICTTDASSIFHRLSSRSLKHGCFNSSTVGRQLTYPVLCATT